MDLTKYKKLLWLIPMIGLLIAVPFIGSTQAYLTDNEKQTNELGFINVTAEIDESFDPSTISRTDNHSDPGQEDDVVQTTISYNKVVNVKNTGSAPCFVRVYLDFSDSAVRSYSKFNEADNADQGGTWLYTDYWEYKDGYYYYKEKLEVGKTTTQPLLSSVITEFPSGTDPYDYEIIVYSEAVQVVANDGTVYGDSDYIKAFNDF